MKNNIAFFEKSIGSLVTICKRIDVKFIFAFNFALLTELLPDFSKQAILFLIYLLANKGKCLVLNDFAFIINQKGLIPRIKK